MFLRKKIDAKIFRGEYTNPVYRLKSSRRLSDRHAVAITMGKRKHASFKGKGGNAFRQTAIWK